MEEARVTIRSAGAAKAVRVRSETRETAERIAKAAALIWQNATEEERGRLERLLEEDRPLELKEMSCAEFEKFRQTRELFVASQEDGKAIVIFADRKAEEKEKIAEAKVLKALRKRELQRRVSGEGSAENREVAAEARHMQSAQSMEREDVELLMHETLQPYIDGIMNEMAQIQREIWELWEQMHGREKGGE